MTAQTKAAGTSPTTVVIVDDDPRFLRILSEMLASTGAFSVVGEAHCGEDALDVVVDVRADVVVVDVQMPGANGFETTRNLLARRPDLRVVITSGTDEDAFQELSTEVGAVGFVPKRSLSCEALTSLLTPPAGTRR